MVPLGPSAHALAQAPLLPATRINDVVNKTRAITADIAVLLPRYFGTTTEFSVNLQAAFNLRSAAVESSAWQVHTRGKEDCGGGVF